MQATAIPCRRQVTLPSSIDCVQQEFERILQRRGASQTARAVRLRCAILLQGAGTTVRPRFD